MILYSESMQNSLKSIEQDLGRVFRAKKKFSDGNYCIFMTSQYYKEQLISYIKDNLDGVESLITSGSIKKCKDFIRNHASQEPVKTET